MASLNSLPNWVVFPSPHSTAKEQGRNDIPLPMLIDF